MNQEITREQAIALSHTNFWKQMVPRDVAVFQLFTERLCVPFSDFHKAVETTLGRPVFTHEFGMGGTAISDALLAGAPEPTFEDLVNLIPEQHRHLVRP